jgi:hypothetical protein
LEAGGQGALFTALLVSTRVRTTVLIALADDRMPECARVDATIKTLQCACVCQEEGGQFVFSHSTA